MIPYKDLSRTSENTGNGTWLFRERSEGAVPRYSYCGVHPNTENHLY